MTWQSDMARRMVQRDVLTQSREMPPNCRLAPEHPGTLKCEELFTRFEESSEVAHSFRQANRKSDTKNPLEGAGSG